MKLSDVKNVLPELDNVMFKLEDGTLIPDHFHVTEIGMIIKNFIDCGGTLRTEKAINFQLWSADDIDHRLEPMKLLDIIHLSEQKLGIEDEEIEVEYQSKTIGKYGLRFEEGTFVLTNKQTDCLAVDSCGVPVKLSLTQTMSCSPGGMCC